MYNLFCFKGYMYRFFLNCRARDVNISKNGYSRIIFIYLYIHRLVNTADRKRLFVFSKMIISTHKI